MITTELVRRIRAASDGGDDVVIAMREIAARALPDGVTSDDDFEVLVGAFGSESRTLGYLRRLAELTEPQDDGLRDAIQRVSTFAERVRDNGLSHVLQVIFENSHAYMDESEHLHAFTRAVTTSFSGRVTFANLNYDTLLLSGLLSVCSSSEVADLGHGGKKWTATRTDGTKIKVPALRESKHDFKDSQRIRLINLHGSITYWATKDGRAFAKLSREHLEDLEQWQGVRDGTTSLRPVVVLASQKDKSAHVQEFPFSLAYEMFVDALADSDHWLIVGYSFRDVPVNAKLQAEFNERALEQKPRVLVVTYGDDLSVREIERAFGWGQEDGSSVNWLTVVRSGANGVETTEEWADFHNS
ncbi:SIR2 family protein [Microbacterium sp. NPDC089698]|uniref:SIR2 family protein n=1 Tax=Microbacterium sp. NPDC089698 TaxID=3364200 RepID=UPI003814D552